MILRDNTPALIQLYLDGLVADGWGQEILIRDFDRLYTDETAQLQPSPHLFRDYVNYTKDHEKNAGYEKAKKYWQNRIETMPDAPELPLIKSPASVTNPSVSHVKESISQADWAMFEKNCSEKGITTSNAMMTVLGKVLARWCRKNSFIINLPVSNRFFDNVSYENTFGVFSDFFLFDIHDEKDESFNAAALKNQKKLHELTANKAFSGMDVLHEMAKIRKNIGNAAPVVFTSLIDIPEYPENYVSKKYFQTHTSQIWLDIIVLKCDGEIQLSCDYVVDILERRTITAIMSTFVDVIRKLSRDIEYWNKCDFDIISEIPINIDSAAGKKVDIEYVPIIDLLKKSVEKYADNIAVCSSQRCYTYQELFEDVGKTVLMLQNKGISKGNVAAILMDKRYEQIVSVLAVVLCGGVYLPIDTQNSSERINYCISESEASVLITDNAMIEKYGSEGFECTVINVDSDNWNEVNGRYVRPDVSADDLYCIIYTSGSTGVPKGVMLPQKGLHNCLEYTNKLLKIKENDRIISLTNLCHDMSIYDIFGMLIAGAGIVIPDSDKIKEPSHWIWLVEKYNVTIWNSVPAITEMALETLEYTGTGNISSLRAIIMGGDVLQVNIPSRLRAFAPNITVFNVGGPTEATIWSICHKVEKEDESLVRIPLGKAIDNVNYMVLDYNLRICPYDTVGTIYCEGVNLSRGYLKAEEKTKEKFIINKYTGNLMYNTGDLGKYRTNGDIDIIGREDHQIKINGKRIELGEIEAAALKSNKIDTVAAVFDPDNRNIYIYYKVNTPVSENELKDELAKHLPDFMQPSQYIEISNMPLTRNGKVDKSKLKKPDTSSASLNEAMSDTEKSVYEIYKDVIQNDEFGINDNFFNIGGDSLKAIKLLYSVTERFKVSLQLIDIFKNFSVRKLASYIDNNSFADEIIVHNEPTDKMELSLAQKGMWFQVRSAEQSNSSHIFMLAGTAYIKTSEFNKALFDKAVNILIMNNPELRTEIFEVDYTPYIRYAPFSDYYVVHSSFDLSAKNAAEILEKKAISEIYDTLSYPMFTIETGEGNDGFTAVTIGIHHIIADAYSVSKIISKIEEYYKELLLNRNIQTESGSINYNDFTVWQYKHLNDNYYEKDIEYWQKKLSNVTFNKFTESNEQWGDFEGASFDINVAKEALDELKRICKENNCSVFTGIVSIVNILIGYYFESENAAIGIAYSGRNKAEIKDIIGSFAVGTAVITEMNKEMTFDELLKRTDYEMKQTIEHSNLPFNVIIEKSGIDMRYSSLIYNVLVNCLDTDLTEGNMMFTDFRYSSLVVPADMIVTAELSHGKDRLYMLYRKNLFDIADIEEWSKTIADIIEIITSDCKISLKKINERLDGQ